MIQRLRLARGLLFEEVRFGDLQQVLGTDGTLARPSVMPMDAWRDGDTFQVEFDLPGINPDSIDLDVERNVITVKAERPPRASDAELIAAERPAGYSAGS